MSFAFAASLEGDLPLRTPIMDHTGYRRGCRWCHDRFRSVRPLGRGARLASGCRSGPPNLLRHRIFLGLAGRSKAGWWSGDHTLMTPGAHNRVGGRITLPPPTPVASAGASVVPPNCEYPYAVGQKNSETPHSGGTSKSLQLTFPPFQPPRRDSAGASAQCLGHGAPRDERPDNRVHT